MSRAASLSVVLGFFGIASFTACGSDDVGPIGDTIDGGPRNKTGTSGSRGTSGTFDGSNPSSTSSNGSPAGNCESSRDCNTGEECLPGGGEASFCTSVRDGGSSGVSSSGGGASSSGNPSGAGVGERCDNDTDCAGALCVTSKNTGVLFCSKPCVKGADNYDPVSPNDATNCPIDLPRCGDEAGRPDPVCRADI